jgi:hypothetical protein
VADRTGLLAPVIAMFMQHFQAKRQKAAYLYENIKVFRPFAAFED